MLDYLIIGAGLFGATFARIAHNSGKRVLVIDQRSEVGGNCRTEEIEGIHVHQYGPHIFHTSNEIVWEFVNKYARFNSYINTPYAFAGGSLYSLPFNMNTFYNLWGVSNPDDAKSTIDNQRLKLEREPKNLEEQALTLVGHDIYYKLIRDYTIKQWQKDPKDLPASIIKRLPIRYTFNNNYFNDKYQGIPSNGYTRLFENLLDGIEVKLDVNYSEFKKQSSIFPVKTVYTGKIDEFYNYIEGELEYRSLSFNHETLYVNNFQGNAVINYCDKGIPFTRIIEHKHFMTDNQPNHGRTIISREYPQDYSHDKVPYYPINNNTNDKIYKKYKARTITDDTIIFGGRLAEYKYYDMHAVIASAILACKKERLSATPGF
jgi:UDP-galactopyranose mutase